MPKKLIQNGKTRIQKQCQLKTKKHKRKVVLKNAPKNEVIPPLMTMPASQSHLRFIIIDGSNVAIEHGNQQGNAFSCQGIKIAVDFFINRGHNRIKVMLPRFRRGNSDVNYPTVQPEILDYLEKNSFITYTPSRYINNELIVPYDDRFILKAAAHYDAIIVSNDNYRDLMKEKTEWKILVEKNLLQYTFVGDLFLIADDPLGRKGPHLNQFLTVANKNKILPEDQIDLNQIQEKQPFSDISLRCQIEKNIVLNHLVNQNKLHENPSINLNPMVTNPSILNQFLTNPIYLNQFLAKQFQSNWPLNGYQNQNFDENYQGNQYSNCIKTEINTRIGMNSLNNEIDVIQLD